MSKLDETLDYLAESYYPEHEYNGMHREQNTKLRNEAKQQIKELFIEVVTDHLDDLIYTGIIKEAIEQL